MVALGTGHPVEPFLEDRVLLVPKGKGQAEALFDIAEPGEAVLAPAVGAGAGLVVGQVVPRLDLLAAVVLPDRPPRPLAQVGTPAVPGTRLEEAVLRAPEGGHPLALLAPRGRVIRHEPSLSVDPRASRSQWFGASA